MTEWKAGIAMVAILSVMCGSVLIGVSLLQKNEEKGR